jgi:hypothetical protein
MKSPSVRLTIPHGVDEFAEACLSAIDTSRPEDRLLVIRSYMQGAVRAACRHMADAAKKGVQQAASLMEDPDYYERRRQRRGRRLREQSIVQQEQEQRRKGIVH